MVKHVLNLTLKIALLLITMVIVGRVVHVGDIISGLLGGHIGSDSANKLETFIIGESDPEPYESLIDYISIIITTLISVPLFSFITAIFYAFTKRIEFKDISKEWAISTQRRFAKLFTFVFFFWALFRVLPYETLFPGTKTYSSVVLILVVGFNLALTFVCYYFVTKKVAVFSPIKHR